jgi:FkbM family methyltransferase
MSELQRISAYVSYWGSAGALQMLVNEARSGESREVLVSPRGLTGQLRLRTHSSDIHTFKQVIARREYDIPELSNVRTIIDAGANIGLASIYFTERFPNAQIIALEPEESNFDLLSRNLAGRPNVTCLKKALWHESGTVTVFDPGDGQWGFRTAAGAAPEGQSGRVIGRVECVTVPEIMRQFGLERVDLLKIDVEGSEREVFLDSAGWIDRVDAIAIELHDRFKRGCAKAFYDATQTFQHEVHRGENVFVFRNRPATG